MQSAACVTNETNDLDLQKLLRPSDQEHRRNLLIFDRCQHKKKRDFTSHFVIRALSFCT